MERKKIDWSKPVVSKITGSPVFFLTSGFRDCVNTTFTNVVLLRQSDFDIVRYVNDYGDSPDFFEFVQNKILKVKKWAISYMPASGERLLYFKLFDTEEQAKSKSIIFDDDAQYHEIEVEEDA